MGIKYFEGTFQNWVFDSFLGNKHIWKFFIKSILSIKELQKIVILVILME